MLHLGIIPDGNKRYTKEYKMDPSFERIEELVEILFIKDDGKRYNINELTIFMSSFEDLTIRSDKELKKKMLYKLYYY